MFALQFLQKSNTEIADDFQFSSTLSKTTLCSLRALSISQDDMGSLNGYPPNFVMPSSQEQETPKAKACIHP